MQRYVTLPEARVSLRGYVAAVKKAKRHPKTTFSRGLSSVFAATGEEIVRDFRRAMQERITAGVPRSAAWPGPVRWKGDRRLHKRLLLRLRRDGRECKWCGTRFRPETINDKFCDPGCRRSYYL